MIEDGNFYETITAMLSLSCIQLLYIIMFNHVIILSCLMYLN